MKYSKNNLPIKSAETQILLVGHQKYIHFFMTLETEVSMGFARRPLFVFDIKFKYDVFTL
jgi:hypothetical protein